MELRFGKFKGKTVEEVAGLDEGAKWLDWLRKNTDVNDPKFGKSNKAMVAEINRVLGSGAVSGATPKSLTEPDLALSYLKRIDSNLNSLIAAVLKKEEKIDEIPF